MMQATARHTTARTIRPDGVMIALSQTIQSTPFRLPDDLPDEAD
jgi:hypothetical protein